jgi:hypothetical protein
VEQRVDLHHILYNVIFKPPASDDHSNLDRNQHLRYDPDGYRNVNRNHHVNGNHHSNSHQLDDHDIHRDLHSHGHDHSYRHHYDWNGFFRHDYSDFDRNSDCH